MSFISLESLLVFLLLIEKMCPVNEGEQKEAGWKGNSGQNINFFGRKFVVSEPGRQGGG